MKAAEAIVECLKQENVKIVFGYPGAAVIAIYEALRKSDIKHILTRHEQAAGHSASGYARATGTTGVCIATSGPGATNIITSIATAYMDSTPLVIITGQVRTNLIGRDAFQEADIVGATESFTKHSYLVKNAKEIPRIIKEAFYIASTGRPGPVLIDIPADLQEIDIDFKYPNEVDIRGYKPTVKGHKGQIKRVLERLKDSRRPLICVGGGIALAKAEKELKSFVEKSKIPVVHTLMGKDCMESDNPYYMGLIGSHGFRHANLAVQHADLLIFIGTRIADRAASGTKFFADNAYVIHIDVDPAEIGKNIGYNIPVVGDAKNILQQLTSGVSPLNTEEWVEEIKAFRSNRKYEMDTDRVSPKYALRLLSEMVEDDAVITTDVGQNQIWSVRNFGIKESTKFITSGGLGTMGYGLPSAVGAKFGVPSRRVIAVTGDGGFQMSLFELGTIAEYDVNIIILLFNNSGLGMVREIQRNVYREPFGVAINSNPDFVKLVEAYGLKGRRVSTNQELQDAFQEALASEKAFLIECMVNPMESTL
ncbi:MAG: biosynthetic-type acetolactate synthase large subunit [Bacillota bacterium]|nr:biosynthetic-type acetolactate synthase large subunit [Bacillota bacterium]